MGEKRAFENGRISDFQGLVTLTLTLNRVILHIPSCICRRPLPTYQISLKSKKHWTDGRTVRTDGHLRQALLGRLATPPLFVNRFRWNFIGTSCILGTNVYKVNGVDFRFDVITSFYDVIPRVILDWSLFYIELCYCQVPTFALWFDIWNHINPVSACYSVA